MVIDTVVVDNFELIKSLMHFESDGDFYLLQILQRRKENPEMESARAYVVKSYYIRSIDHLNKLENEIREFCKIFSARAYISPSAKNWKNVSKIAIKKSLDYVFEGKETLMDKVIESSAAESIPKNKLWVVDIDTTDEKVISKIIEAIECCESGYSLNTKAVVPTINGVHLITHPFNVKQIEPLMCQYDFKVEKNRFTLLYYSN